jgi:Flp pilus assembly protein TadG
MTPFDPLRSLFSAIIRILHDKSGASATIVAIALPGLIGFGALGVETGVWFTLKLQNQSAADAAALSAAYQVIAGKTDVISGLTPAASEAATRNGYQGATPAVVYPYSDSLVSNGVAVTLQQTQGALFGAMFLSNVTVATKAVAVIEVLDNPCILALGTSGAGVEVADFTHLDMPNCSAAANSISRSAIELHGSTSSIAAATLVTAGEITLQGNPISPAAPPPEFTVASQVRIGAPSVVDPYARTLTHNYLATGMPPSIPHCGSTPSGELIIYEGNCGIPGTSLMQSSIKLTGNTRISGGWSILTSQTVDLSPGIYWITGNLTVQSSGVLKCSTCDNAKGTGVTIILPAETGKVGAVSMAANAMFNLNAPNSGRLPGVVMVQDANGLPAGTTYPSSHSSVTGAPGATLNGLVYFPNSSLTFHGNPSATGPKCLVLVVNTLMVDQTSSLETRGCAGAGLTDLPTVSTVALAE